MKLGIFKPCAFHRQLDDLHTVNFFQRSNFINFFLFLPFLQFTACKQLTGQVHNTGQQYVREFLTNHFHLNFTKEETALIKTRVIGMKHKKMEWLKFVVTLPAIY